MMKKKITALLVGIFTLVINAHAQIPTVTFTATPAVICPGDSVHFVDTATFYPTSWTWYRPGSSIPYYTTTNAPGIPPGVTYTYPGVYYATCVVKNLSGTDSATVQACVTVKPLPRATIEPPSGGLCNPSLDTVFFTVIDTTRGNTYSWLPSSSLTCASCTDPGAYPIPPTVYTLTVKGADGCSITLTDTVSTGTITAEITGEDSICSGFADTLIASGGSVGGSNSNSNNAGTSYLWSNGKTTSSIIVSPAVTTTYSVTIITGSGPCTSSAAFKVNVYPAPKYTLSFAPFDSICYPGSITINATPGNYQYFWYGAPYGVDTTDNFKFTPSQAPINVQSIYTFTLVVRNLGCHLDSVIKIKVNNPPKVHFTGANDLCQFSSTTITAYGGGQYQWSTGQTTSSINVTAVISKTYTVAVTSGQCVKDTSFTITVDTMPSTVFKGRDSICAGQNTTIYALDTKGVPGYGYSYLWNTGSTGDSVYTGNLTNPGTYPFYLTVSKGACSKDSSEIIVKVFPLPKPVLYPNDTTVCEYDSVRLTAAGGNYYIWSPKKSGLNHYLFYGDTDKNNAAPPVTTAYKVKVCTWGCCTGDTGIHPPIPIPTATVNIIPSVQGYSVCCSQTVSGGTPVQLTATYDPSPSYYIAGWSPATGLSCTNCANPTATDYNTTTYVVTFADLNGCTVKDSVTIDIFNCNVFVPDVFSPNGDGINDRLYVRSLCLKSMSFAVFDRWGNKVFETLNQDNGWDGTYKGKAMDIGTYMWYLTGLLDDGTHISKSGNVNLVR